MDIRLADIAERVGVSISTVSRVLNDKPGVNPHTRRQVLTALDVLGYDRPSRLRPRSAGLVGLILPELENPFFPRLAQNIEGELARRGYTPALCSQSAGGVPEDNYVNMLLEHGVVGIIFVSGIHAIAAADPGRYTRLVDLGLPIVLINGYLPGVKAPFLSTDDVAAMGFAVAHLANMGHERIGLALGEQRYTPVIRKARGFMDAMRRQKPALPPGEVAELVEHTAFTVEGGTLAAHRLLDRGVTAVICASDVMALGAIRAVRSRGLEVPRDVSVVGSDDSLLIEYTDPPLTTIRQPSLAISAAACHSLVGQITGLPPVLGDTLFQPELIVRGSTARVAVADAP